MLPLSGNSNKKDFYYLLPLLIISIASHFPFVLNGFGEIDATKIAVSVIDMLNHGSDAAFSNYYFSGVVPLYIYYLKWAMKIMNYDYSYLPLIMNYTNALIGTLITIPAFLLINKLFGKPIIAFCSVLALIFAPSFHQSTIMGFPHLIAFFFLLASLYFYLSGLDHDQKSSVFLLMVLSSTFLTIAFLFKSDIVLITGIYIGLLFIRKVKDKQKICSAFLIILISGILFLLFRDLMLGSGSGTTMSKEGLSKWYEYSLIIPTNTTYLIRQLKPIAFGAGTVTFSLGIISFIFYMLKKRTDILAFIISWAALPTLFWLVMIGNNARHNMTTILPLLVIIILFIYEKAPRYVLALTALIIMGNFLATPASHSILTPSGNLFKSNIMLKDRMDKFQSSAKQIFDVQKDKIAVLGYFHNPHVILEIMRSSPSYEAMKIGREDYRILTDGKEYIFIYFVSRPEKMKENIEIVLSEYQLHNHTFVSATYDPAFFKDLGLKTAPVDIIQRPGL